MYSDQMRKYGISESMIQALYEDVVGNKVIINACIMDSEIPYTYITPFLIYKIFHFLASFHFLLLLAVTVIECS